MTNNGAEQDLYNNVMSEKDWRVLLDRIETGKCTPILGPGAYKPVLAFQETIARDWAKESRYASRTSEYLAHGSHSVTAVSEDSAQSLHPAAQESKMSLDPALCSSPRGSTDLARIAQFRALEQGDNVYPKEELVRRLLREVPTPDFADDNEPYRVLSELPLSVYLTTNYDNFMVEALKYRLRNPARMLCEWTDFSHVPSGFVSEFDEPTDLKPLVYFCHGHVEFEDSLVLTEDEHLRFLVRVSRLEDKTLHPRIQRALTDTSLMLIGFSPADWCFRVLIQGLLPLFPRRKILSVAVQLQEEDRPLQRYLADYFKAMRVRIFWGSPQAFMAELRQRWDEKKREGTQVIASQLA